MTLFATALIGAFALLALQAAGTRVRMAGDARWGVEASLMVSSALASARLAHRSQLDSLPDGGSLVFPAAARPDGWSWQARAIRTGAVIRLTALAERRGSDGTLVASGRASLLLTRDSADTVRVLGQRPRF